MLYTSIHIYTLLYVFIYTCSPEPGRCSTLTIVMIIIMMIIIIIITLKSARPL